MLSPHRMVPASLREVCPHSFVSAVTITHVQAIIHAAKGAVATPRPATRRLLFLLRGGASINSSRLSASAVFVYRLGRVVARVLVAEAPPAVRSHRSTAHLLCRHADIFLPPIQRPISIHELGTRAATYRLVRDHSLVLQIWLCRMY